MTTLLPLLAAGLLPAAAAAPKPPVVIAAAEHAGPNAEAVAFSPDGTVVAAAFGGPSNGTSPLRPNGGGVAAWDAATGRQLWFHGEYGDVVKLEFSRDGRHLGYARVYTPGDHVRDDAVVVLDAATGAVARRWHDTAVVALSRSADEVFVGPAAYSLKDFAKTRAVAGPKPSFLAASADGGSLAALYLVDVPTGNGEAFTREMKGLAVYGTRTLEKVRGAESDNARGSVAAAVSPDGKTLVTGDNLGSARVWAGDKLAEVAQIDTDAPGHVLPFFSPDGRTLAVATQQSNGPAWKYGRDDPALFRLDYHEGRGCEVMFHDTTTWKETSRWVFQDAAYPTIYARSGGRQHPEYNPLRFAFSPDGKRVLAGCNGVVLVDAATGRPVRQFQVVVPARP